jgi:rhodanese-related sulfurtransferase
MFNIIKPTVPQISADVVKTSIDTHETSILLDVRTVGEYSRNRLEGAIHVSVDEVSDKIESTIPDKSSKIYVYCLSGSRSVHAVDAMMKLGYTNVFNMTGGLLAWRAKGHPVSS